MAALAVRRARRLAREPAMAVSRLKTRLSPLPGAPKCRRSFPGTGCISRSKESSKGLNTESNNPQRASATVLVEIAVERHRRDEHTIFVAFLASCMDPNLSIGSV